MTELDALAVEHACARLQTQYCIYADRCDIDGFVSLFAEDASIKVPEHPALSATPPFALPCRRSPLPESPCVIS